MCQASGHGPNFLSEFLTLPLKKIVLNITSFLKRCGGQLEICLQQYRKHYLQTGHKYLIGNLLYVIWRDSKMKPYNHQVTAVYKALNYNIRDGLTSEKQK